MKLPRKTLSLIFLFFICLGSSIVIAQDTEELDSNDTTVQENIENKGLKAGVKKIISFIGKKAGALIDLVWPSELGENRSVEDPSSQEYQKRQEQIAREQQEREQAESKHIAQEARAQAEQERRAREATAAAARESERQEERERELHRELVERDGFDPDYDRGRADGDAWESESCRRC